MRSTRRPHTRQTEYSKQINFRFIYTALICITVIITIAYRDLYIDCIKEAIETVSAILYKRQILNGVKDYAFVQTAYARCYYTEADADYAESVCGAIDFFYPMLAKDFGVKSEPVTVILYPSGEEMERKMNVKSAPQGAYAAGVVAMLSPSLFTEENDFLPYLKNGPIIHELTHYIMAETFMEAEQWLCEGVALYFENKYTGYEWRPDLSEACKVITAENLRDFRNQDTALAYRRAFELTYAFVEANSEKILVDLLK